MISPIVPVESDTDFLARCRLNQPWYLKTLANPKPSTGVPYFHNSNGRVDELRTRGDAYSKNDILVRKVYPTHRDMLFNTSLGKAEEDPGQINPTQNSRVVSYLKPGAKFRTTMRFVDIWRFCFGCSTLKIWYRIVKRRKTILTIKWGIIDWGTVSHMVLEQLRLPRLISNVFLLRTFVVAIIQLKVV